MKILLTGGAGFIGCNLIRCIIEQTEHSVMNLDKLSYAAHPQSLSTYQDNSRYRFMQCDIRERDTIEQAIRSFMPDAIIHLAGETHVDRSIADPDTFVSNNIVGTHVLLDSAFDYYQTLDAQQQPAFRFLYVSTDEVYGSRTADETVDESAAFHPRSPYAGSKAAATHMVNSYHRTYGLPTLITYCSNNYGPWQHPEKLIPKTIINALKAEAIPIYGDGSQCRDWLYVDDNARALIAVIERGQPGTGYNINGSRELSNLSLVTELCTHLDRLRPRDDGKLYSELIRFVADRPGHDRRYGLDDSRIRNDLSWQAQTSFEQGLEHTLQWYLNHITELN